MARRHRLADPGGGGVRGLDIGFVIPLNRYGLQTELAEAIFFLCSERASYIIGQTLAVDGGFEATGVDLPALREEGRNG
jgi:NAD(P)-dependent dehydrogenase (short-subunit alcohol dehydrogenase family)